MNSKEISIAVDAMGGDNAPFKTLKGIEIFLNNNSKVKIKILGNEQLINRTLIESKIFINNYEIINTTNDVQNEDTANTILRNRKDSSIYKGLELIKNIESSGFVSAGNTAALMILSRLILGMIEGINRPAICSVIPNVENFSIMLDLGANVSVDAKNLLQFAVMGYCYHAIFKKNEDPKIGII